MAFKNFNYMEICHMRISNEELYGLTFYITMYMVRIMFLNNNYQ
jgi:hypothetical protein